MRFAALLFLVALTACSGSQASGATRVEFWTIGLTGKYDAFIHGLMRQFEEAHPGVELIWTDLPQKSLEQKLMATIAGGMAPDLVNVNTSFALRLAENGALVDMQQAVPAAARERYFPNLWEAARYGDGVYAIPWYITTRVLMYNRSILRQAGLDPAQPPRTWDDVARVARQVRERTPHYGYIPVIRLVDDWRMFGVPIYDPKTMRALFATPEGAARLEWYAGLYAEGIIPRESLSEGYQGALDRYKQGSLAILEAGPQLLLRIQADAPSVYAETGIAPLPATPTRTMPASTMNFVVPRAARHRQLAVDLGLFLTNPENQLAFDKEVPLLPSTWETARDEFFRVGKGEGLQDEAIRISVEQLPRARDFSLGLPRQPDLNRALNEAVEAAVYGTRTPREALERAAAEWDAILGVSAGRGAGPTGEGPIP